MSVKNITGESNNKLLKFNLKIIKVMKKLSKEVYIINTNMLNLLTKDELKHNLGRCIPKSSRMTKKEFISALAEYATMYTIQWTCDEESIFYDSLSYGTRTKLQEANILSIRYRDDKKKIYFVEKRQRPTYKKSYISNLVKQIRWQEEEIAKKISPAKVYVNTLVDGVDVLDLDILNKELEEWKYGA